MGVGADDNEGDGMQRVSLGGMDDSLEYFQGGDDGRVSFGQDEGPMLGQDDDMFPLSGAVGTGGFEDALMQPEDEPYVRQVTLPIHSDYVSGISCVCLMIDCCRSWMNETSAVWRWANFDLR
jgi:hypothetical protein